MSRRRLAFTAVAIVVAAVVIGWAVTSSLGRPPSIVVPRSPLLDKPAPAIDLPTLDGTSTISLADYVGRPVVINFWASWCLPCRDEFPLLRATRAAHAGEGLEILGIAHDDTAEAARQFGLDYGATWPLLLDDQDIAWRAYQGTFVPVTYYVDRQGIVRALSYGAPASGTLEEQLAKIL